MKNLLLLYLTLLLSFTGVCSSDTTAFIRIAFYNVENLFDPFDDPEKNDADYLPTGIKGWSYKKFDAKIKNTYKSIAALSDTIVASIVGLCEIENKFVLDKLTRGTPLKARDYRYIHYESPDARGVDVALLYIPKYFTPVSHKAICITFPFDTIAKTRDILYIKGYLKSNSVTGDTIHIFVCHFPSRYGGLAETIIKREYTAQTVRAAADSILRAKPEAAIIIMGDLNDGPEDKSIKETLCYDKRMINLMNGKKGIGTLKHGAFWDIFDHIIVSESLLKGDASLNVCGGAHIGAFDFLLTEDKKYGGQKLFRTHVGAKYLGGYSDHLPVYIDLKINNSKKKME